MKTINVPRLYLGDRGFLKRYGTPYTTRRIRTIMEYAATEYSIGIASSDQLTAAVANSIFSPPLHLRHIFHSRFFIRAWSSAEQISFTWREMQANPGFFSKASDIEFDINYDALLTDLLFIDLYRPGIVTVGGDWLDILIWQRRYDLINKIIEIIALRIPADLKLLLLSFESHPYFFELLDSCRFWGAALPVNILSISESAKTTFVAKVVSKVPVFALHCLSGGIIPIRPAIEYALNHVGATAAIIGATKIKNIREIGFIAQNYADLSL